MKSSKIQYVAIVGLIIVLAVIYFLLPKNMTQPNQDQEENVNGERLLFGNGLNYRLLSPVLLPS